MDLPYPKHAVTYDADAKRATLRCVRGDTLDVTVEVNTRHDNPYVVGEVLELPVDVGSLSWDSLVCDSNGTPVASFVITDDPMAGNTITLTIDAHDTESLVPGAYTYWLDSVHTVTGIRRTWLRGTLTITPKP